MFTVEVEVNGRSFRGQANAKKKAKLAAAEAALASFVQLPHSGSAPSDAGANAAVNTLFKGHHESKFWSCEFCDSSYYITIQDLM